MNNRITNILINMGITNPDIAYKIMLHYKRTGKIIDIRL